MSAIHLVRHGQASFGTDDYDRLSERGFAQATALGQAWEASGFLPTRAVAGSMKRHAQTAIAALDAAGPSDGYDVDDGWDEFAHESVVEAYAPGRAGTVTDPKEFQKIFLGALGRWTSGHHDGDYAESYAHFTNRVLAAFDRLTDSLDGRESVVVFTSGGPLAVVAAHVLAGDAETWTPEAQSLWPRLSTVAINAGVTTLITGSTGRTLVSFNEHTHLPTDLVTYR
ncbi:histidine phosphatase family protein [Mumia sp. zg.B21]|uniref:histidine phosphatase family protein n=1 Tax=Mumia sp. zg.B21 TaxID=2855447 RepID=UPI001C6E4EAC|nr:histidine phosphatase family protein [Mumia sp. zg.B21]MBW9209732.1 histidine phosphatase family protein [Mumia sp. zg.B21]